MIVPIVCKTGTLFDHTFTDGIGHKEPGGSFLLFKSNDLVKMGTGQGQQFQIGFDIILVVKTIFFIEHRKLRLDTGRWV